VRVFFHNMWIEVVEGMFGHKKVSWFLYNEIVKQNVFEPGIPIDAKKLLETYWLRKNSEIQVQSFDGGFRITLKQNGYNVEEFHNSSAESLCELLSEIRNCLDARAKAFEIRDNFVLKSQDNKKKTYKIVGVENNESI
jgi:hypothetical protein